MPLSFSTRLNRSSKFNIEPVRAKRKSQFGYSVLEARHLLSTFYYVNDLVYDPAFDEYTTAAGSTTNTGLTPESPRSSIRSIVADYDLGPDSTILVDDGVYAITENISFGPADSGNATAPVTVQGPVNPDATATIDRGGNTTFANKAFEFDNAGFITIANFTITNAYHGIYLRSHALNNHITIRDNVIARNFYGIDAYETLASNIVIFNNTIHDNTKAGIDAETDMSGWRIFDNESYRNADYGIRLVAPQGEISGNLVYRNAFGIIANNSGAGEEFPFVVSDNTALGNQGGIVASGDIQVSNNLIHNNNRGIIYHSGSSIVDNVVHDNQFGIGEWLDYDSNLDSKVISGNRIFNNREVGLNAAGKDVFDNVVYSNRIGILANGENYQANIHHNLVYDSELIGILSQGKLVDLTNNTIYEPTAIALTIVGTNLDSQSGSDDTVEIRNNILVALDGLAIRIADDGQENLLVDYNLYHTPNTDFGEWGSVRYDNYLDWLFATQQDQHSLIDAAPQLINPPGRNNTLGYDRTPIGSPFVIDDSDSRFSFDGNWSFVSGPGYQGGHHRTTTSTGVASWDVQGLASGVYEIYSTWPLGNFAYGALYEARESSPDTLVSVESNIRLATSYVAQNHAIPDDLTYDGVPWEWLGTAKVEGSRLVIDVRQDVNYFPVIADGLLLQRVRGDFGSDDNFHLEVTSPAVDRGDIDSYYFLEPGAGGGRVNLGVDGNTSDAVASPSQSLQILTPNGLEKFITGQDVDVRWRSWGLQDQNAIALVNSGSHNSYDGWLFDNYRTDDGTSDSIIAPIDTTDVESPASYPVYQSFAQALSGTNNEISYEFPLSDGTYDVRLHFTNDVDEIGDRLFDILANDQLVFDDFDIAARTGGMLKATDYSFSVTINDGGGLQLRLLNQTLFGAILSGIDLTQAAAGSANVGTDLSYSADDGSTFHPIIGASGIPLNTAGRGIYTWTAAGPTNGNVGRINVTSNSAFLSDQSDAGFTIVAPSQVHSFVINRGTIVAGGLPEISLSDNVDLRLRRDIGSILPLVELELTGLSPALSPSSFEFVLESAVFARSQITQIIWLFNYHTNEFEQVDSRLASRFDDLVTVVTPAGDLTRFVNFSTGEIRSRARFVSPEQRENFSVNIDQIIWRII